MPKVNKQIYKSTSLQINKVVVCSLFIFAYLLICLFNHSSSVHAQQVLPLSVVPPKQEVLVNPGEHFSTSVKFLNQGDTPITGTLSVLDFVVTDDKGTPVFLDNPQIVGTTTLPAKYSAAKWISIPNSNMAIGAKSDASVPITIEVPKNAAPGGRYAAVIFQPGGDLTLGNPVSGQENAIAVRLASLLYVRVAGPITENATVTKFEGPGFLEYGPATISTEILNQGDYHISPEGSITMKDMFGRVVSKVNIDQKNIFPGTSRSYSTQVGEKLMFGQFTLNLSAKYGDKNQVLTSAMTMWIFPWRATLAIVLAIAIIILLVVFWFKRFVKKEEKLVEELKEEKTELEELKAKFKDEIKGDTTTGEKTPEQQTPPKPETP